MPHETTGATGELVFVQGHALDPVTGSRAESAGTITEETTAAISAMRAALQDSGCDLGDLLKVNCYLSEDEYRTGFWATWDAAFAGVPGRIVRITQVCGLAADSRVLLDATAVRP